ncbi:MAG: hypothetical protein IJT23_08570 [Clostridia bacterium]|nr:hypothetical protein [Clostridia bacterium]
MKKLYESPAIEVTKFIAEDILCASTVSFDGVNYDVIEDGVAVNDGGVQRISTAQMSDTYFGQ